MNESLLRRLVQVNPQLSVTKYHVGNLDFLKCSNQKMDILSSKTSCTVSFF